MSLGFQLGELLFSAGEADLQSLDFTEPALAFGLGDPVRLSRISSSRGCWAASGRSIEQRTQACS
ncbi:hypothetical protein [Streptomyces nanshensis]|uniref:Uncharacterized protein n=1 Tax=Streptomyces nanshensis TaxID=518642 RepID=A0A1E7L5U3_9ACTN|nr:hypothetical protein [Streptomyces nanshensis]OEV11548.1 hypothetical protein AN218_12420 [Streptomyces nanshensis]